MGGSVVEGWERFEHALPKLGVRAALAQGASEAALADFERVTQLTLPDAVRAFFRTHDGQTSTEAGLASGFYFVSLAEAQKLLNDWSATRTKLGDGIKELDRACSSNPPKAIQRKYSLPGWVPLLRDNEGNAIGVDLQPGGAGTSAQIINFGRDEDDKYVLFQSVSELLDWLATELESGRIQYDRDDKVVRHENGRLVAAILETRGSD
jgi:cell wall assembly regulator SMI1